ncbi:hypothetical protein ACIRRH_31725 [Kitasatospora sp. NPDC101235]|uniref:hypothetical protein n=1 Tax=Kitasatospora sp. NPDC101235 TaxID=3364101 RepID=UPI00380ACA93
MQPNALFGQLAADDGFGQCREWAECLTAWAEQRIGGLQGREETVLLLAEALHRFPRTPLGFGAPLVTASLEEVAASVGDGSVVARQVGRVLACHREAVTSGSSSAVGARRHALAEMLRERPDRGLGAALAGSAVLGNTAGARARAVVDDQGPSAPPRVSLSLYRDHDDPPYTHDDNVLNTGVYATGPGACDFLHEGTAHGLLLASLPGLDDDAVELVLGRLLHDKLIEDVVGIVSPRRCAVLLERGSRGPDRSWSPLLVELDTEEDHAVWAGIALREWTVWAALRRFDLTDRDPGQVRGRHRPDAVLPHTGAVQVVAPDGTGSTARIASARLIDWQAPWWRRNSWDLGPGEAGDQ